jgi:hypothetical protein
MLDFKLPRNRKNEKGYPRRQFPVQAQSEGENTPAPFPKLRLAGKNWGESVAEVSEQPEWLGYSAGGEYTQGVFISWAKFRWSFWNGSMNFRS